ncbi:hypothetical protein RB195_005583 [Necator americanus]|uniref:SCP domain-containing protein n=1 Tax=Necator americanus TaxID=51031 RepID=A0ABR1BNL0_NECAM
MRKYLLNLLATLFVFVSFSKVAPFAIPKPFGCKNSLISDDWRTAVLNFHNEHRRTVAMGEQTCDNGTKTMPVSKKMNELVWDCDLEHNAWLNLCDTNIAVDPSYTTTDEAGIAAKGECNITEKAVDVLQQWWNEATTQKLGTAKYSAKIKNFGKMALGEVRGFACTYRKCDGTQDNKFICIYDKKPENGKTLYSYAKTDKDKVCSDCPLASCQAYLCQYEYAGATNANPQPTCKDDGMTYDMQVMAENMHNYYRRITATGWAQDKSGYAPRAKKMNALKYNCDLGKASVDLIDCDNPTYETATGPLNYRKFEHTVTVESALKQAITGWFDELKEVDVDDEAKYTADVKRNAKDFANMVVGDATKVGCAAKQCLKQGFTAAVCKYDKEPQIDTAMYEVGNPCSGCTCDPLGGLCVTP